MVVGSHSADGEGKKEYIGIDVGDIRAILAMQFDQNPQTDQRVVLILHLKTKTYLIKSKGETKISKSKNLICGQKGKKFVKGKISTNFK